MRQKNKEYVISKITTGKKCKNNSRIDGEDWVYSPEVREHFFYPKNILFDETGYKADGIGTVGSPECGDVINVWIKIDKMTERIKDCKWRTFGCASAIASASMMSQMALENGGMTLNEAKNLKPQQIIERLGGLPDRKFHCSVLSHKALRDAVLNYFEHYAK